MAPSGIDELNDAQRAAATAGDGPLLIIAGAGTGKTRTLVCRVAHLIDRGVDPQRILLLTFTRRAAAQMIDRAQRLCGPKAAGIWGGTFHAVGSRLLRQYGQALGLSPEFSVIDQSDAADAMNLVRTDLGLAEQNRRFPRKATLVGIYSRCVSSRTPLKQLLDVHYPWCAACFDGIRQVFEAYTQRKRQQHVLDYDDLLLYWRALCDVPNVGEEIAGRFDHLLVDEYQDTNLVQAEILQAMRRQVRHITVVGDDAQSIYSFRAATVDNILKFPEQFAVDGQPAPIVKLEENYRSTQPILDASNHVMADAKRRYTKELFCARPSDQRPTLTTCMDEAEQCDMVCRSVLQRLEQQTPLREQAVLFRTGHHSDALEVELTRRGIPFVKYGGLKFVEAAHVKDTLAILRLLENPADELAWHRTLMLLEGVGPVTARKVVNELRVAKSPLQTLRDDPPAVPPAASRDFAALRAMVQDVALLPGTAPAPQIQRLRQFYEPILEQRYDNPHLRARDLDQLEQIATGYRTRQQFLTDLTLDPPTSAQDLAGAPLLEEDYLILSTIHSAKGLEWDVVHILHCADGMIPSDMATGDAEQVEEERRLLYVAMTRARKELNLYFPLRYYHKPPGKSDRHSYAQLSRFLPQGRQLNRLFHRRNGERVEQAESGGRAAVQQGTPEAVDKLLSGLWS